MILGKWGVVIVGIALVAVAVGAGYILLNQNPSGTPSGAAPKVTATSPANAATGTMIDAQIVATFSKAMNPTTITTTTFTVKHGTVSVAGIVTYSGLTATFTPTRNLAALAAHTATITTGAKDPAGGVLASNFVWSFTTGINACDCTAPVVASTSPAPGASGVALNAGVSANFNMAMNPSTVTAATFLLTQGSVPVPGAVSYAGISAAFDPASDFAPNTAYTAKVTTGVKGVSGLAMANTFSWTFSTGQITDTTRPIVSSTYPGAGGNAAVNSEVSATFSEPMDPSTLTASTFLLMQGATPISGYVSYAGLTATFVPSSGFTPDSTYTATITAGARDLAGNALQSELVWSFSTSSSACGQLPVNLGSAAGFAVVAGSTVTNSGGSTLTGDVALSPGSEVVGFPPGTVVGTIHVADTAAAGAMGDLTIAYNDAAGRTLCPVSVAGNLGGMTLVPGLYKSTSGLEVTSGDLTLDAQGDSNAVFIFQIASTLITTEGRYVFLTGGAKASNVFWQVGTSATLGVNSSFVGTIMADQSVSLETGAALQGRALARIGAVTLDESTVVKPAA
jgi:hypothetical protein